MPGFNNASIFEIISIWGVLCIAFVGLGYAMLLRSQVMKCDKGTEKMQEVWNAIRVGADAYLKRQLKSIIPLIGVFTILLFLSVYFVPPSKEAMERFSQLTADQVKITIGLGRAIAFIMGSVFSLMG